jgi:hypothetical protein
MKKYNEISRHHEPLVQSETSRYTTPEQLPHDELRYRIHLLAKITDRKEATMNTAFNQWDTIDDRADDLHPLSLRMNDIEHKASQDQEQRTLSPRHQLKADMGLRLLVQTPQSMERHDNELHTLYQSPLMRAQVLRAEENYHQKKAEYTYCLQQYQHYSNIYRNKYQPENETDSDDSLETTPQTRDTD